MACDHKQVRCTNNVFYCLKCGTVVPNPYQATEKKEEPKPTKKGGKHK